MMKATIAQIKSDFGSSFVRVDPLLLAARVLLYILLFGVVVAIVFSIVGLVAYVAGQGADLLRLITDPVWRPVVRLSLGLIVLGQVHALVLKLLMMIASVERDESFILDNSVRVAAIAGHLLAMQFVGFLGKLLGVPIGGDINGFEIGFTLSSGGVAVVVLLFILARVFRIGAAMRDELEGTV